MNEVDENCCDEQEIERIADWFLMADTWVARQGRLAGWLRAQGRSADEGVITQTVTNFLHCNGWSRYSQMGLGDTFRYARAIKEREVRLRATEETD